MQNLTERKLWFWINNIEGIGNIKIRKLLEFFQNPRAVWEADRDKLMNISVINEKDADNICDRDKRKHILERYYILEDKGIGFVFPWEKEYPGRLKELYDKPYILYYKGELPSDKLFSVGVVGARKCSEYGRYVAVELGRTLGMAGVNVISGLAYGIDSEAHRGTLMGGGRTYGVLAGGVDKCYPAGNFNLYMDILEQGGIISEFPPGTATVPGMFPLRNRIISGLSDRIVVVEAGEHSGSLITVSHALFQNRHVYAVPGRIGDDSSIGCNRLIQEGAEIMLSIDTILEDMGFEVSHNKIEEKNNLSLAREEKMLYSLLLDFVPTSLDTLTEALDIAPGEVLTWLLGLELKGYIKEISKNFYVRIK